MKRTSITLLLVLSLMVAGCSSLGGNSASTTSKTSVGQTSTKAADSTTASTSSADEGGSETTSGTTQATTTSGATTTTQATTTSGATTTTSGATTTTQATTTSADSWEKPKPPNTPLQNKMDENNGSRIKDIKVIHKEKASDGGYSDFDVEVHVDTRMANIDPASHGTVKGEPYFLVYADGDLDNGSRFTDTSGTLIERTAIVSQKKDGDFKIQVRPEGLKKAGKDGKVRLMVLLMDRDSDWDDIYGVAWITVDYSPEK